MRGVKHDTRRSEFDSQESEMVDRGGYPMDGAVMPRRNKVRKVLLLTIVILIASSITISVVWVSHRLLGKHTPDGVIAISTKECSSLGSTWRSYEAGGGRFIVGVGTASDDRSEGRTFTFGDIGGSYSQDLTEKQMPEHDHGRVYVESDEVDFKVKRADRGKSVHKLKRERLKSEGAGEAHNNVPPYVALYFCERF